MLESMSGPFVKDAKARCEEGEHASDLWSNLGLLFNLFNPSLAGGCAPTDAFSPPIAGPCRLQSLSGSSNSNAASHASSHTSSRSASPCRRKRRSACVESPRRGLKRTCSRQSLSAERDSATDGGERRGSGLHSASAPCALGEFKHAACCFECGKKLNREDLGCQIFMYADREHCSEECRDMQITKRDLEKMQVRDQARQSTSGGLRFKGRQRGAWSRSPSSSPKKQPRPELRGFDSAAQELPAWEYRASPQSVVESEDEGKRGS